MFHNSFIHKPTYTNKPSGLKRKCVPNQIITIFNKAVYKKIKDKLINRKSDWFAKDVILLTQSLVFSPDFRHLLNHRVNGNKILHKKTNS